MKYGCALARRHAVKCSAKLMPAITMKTIATASTVGLLQYARLSLWVENPPIATVLKACPTASNSFMPASQYARTQVAVMPT